MDDDDDEGFDRGGILDLTSADFNNAMFALKKVHTLEINTPESNYTNIILREVPQDVPGFARFLSTMPNLQRLAFRLNENYGEGSQVKTFKALNNSLIRFEKLQDLEIQDFTDAEEAEEDLLEFLTNHSSTIHLLQLPGEFLSDKHSTFLPKVRNILQLTKFEIYGWPWSDIWGDDKIRRLDPSKDIVLAQHMKRKLKSIQNLWFRKLLMK